MTATPPNWQWCQGLTEEERKQYHDKVNGKVRTIRKAVKAGLVDVVNFVDDIPTPTSDYAICVIPANESAMELLDISRESIKTYAKKCNADYIELTGDQHPDWPMANKWRLHSVTSVYKKTLYLDCDVIVSDKAPNIFDATPDDKISAFDEYPLWKSKNEVQWIEKEQDLIIRKTLSHRQKKIFINNGKTNCPERMINGGVMVIPQSLSDFYKQPNKTYPRQWCFDQHYLTLILPDDKFHRLDLKWNCCHTFGDKFWYFAKDSFFLHLNGLLKNADFRKFTMQQLVHGDYTPCELSRYEEFSGWVTKTFDKMTKSSLNLDNDTQRFNSNKIGILYNNLTPGGAITWLKDFVTCFKKDITGIFALYKNEDYRDLNLGLERCFELDELYELYVKSDIMLYWIYSTPTDIEFFPDFIWNNPLNKKIIFLSHGSLRINSHDYILDRMNPDVSVFINEEAANKYGGLHIPPVVHKLENLRRNPIEKNVLWHHRLDEYKGVEVLSEITTCMPDFTFHVAGSWMPEVHDQNIRNIVTEKIIGDSVQNVFYHGHLDDMTELFEKCSISLSTSFDESFGLSVAESIINGIPSISHCTGIGKYSDVVINYGSHYSEWAKAIRELDGQALESKNQKLFERTFTLDRFKTAWSKILC